MTPAQRDRIVKAAMRWQLQRTEASVRMYETAWALELWQACAAAAKKRK